MAWRFMNKILIYFRNENILSFVSRVWNPIQIVWVWNSNLIILLSPLQNSIPFIKSHHQILSPTQPYHLLNHISTIQIKSQNYKANRKERKKTPTKPLFPHPHVLPLSYLFSPSSGPHPFIFFFPFFSSCKQKKSHLLLSLFFILQKKKRDPTESLSSLPCDATSDS